MDQFIRWMVVTVILVITPDIFCAGSTVIIADYKQEVAREVFDRLVEAKGVKNMPVPKFRMVNSQRNVAWSNAANTEIGLEEKAYDICVSFGADSLNALAGILAHELTHYYEKHGWTEMFAADFSTLESTAAIARLDQHLPQETQADYLGGFLAYAAGYQTLEIMPAFLEKVYQSYGFNETMAGYPSLADRKKMATNSLQRCQELIHVFEMANYLVALKDYSAAKKYYQYILNDFQSREMFNNLGVATTLEAMSLFSPKDLRFAYPIELDAASRLSSSQRGGEQGFANDQAIREALLKTAIGYFKTAIVLDEDYALGYLNLGNVYALLDQDLDATYNAQKAIRIAQSQSETKIIADAWVLLGILSAQSKKEDLAIEHFDKAAAAGSNLGVINKQPFTGQAKAPNVTMPNLGLIKAEKIGSLSLDQLVIDLQRENLTPDLYLEVDRQSIFAQLKDEHSEVLIHLLPFDERYIFLQLAKSSYSGTTSQGVRNGSSKSEIIAAYNEADHHLQLRQGEYLVYLKQQIIFVLDKKGVVSQWGIFRTST